MSTATASASASASAAGAVVAGSASASVSAPAVYGIAGMSCEHCSTAVTEALSALPGVTGVEIDLPGKRALVTAAAPLETAAVRDAVEAAGYQLI